MSKEGRRSIEQKAESTVTIPRTEWGEFLQSFSRRHAHRPVTLETQDRQTDEDVVSHATPLRAIELDLEDVRNTRINITVESGNKLIKHILFQPSRMVLCFEKGGADKMLLIDSVNTATTLRLPIATPPALEDEEV